MKRSLTFLLCSLTFAACGNDADKPPTSILGYPVEFDPDFHTTRIPEGGALVLNMGIDYTSSSLAAFTVKDPSHIQDNIIVAGGDSILRTVQGHAFVINRGAESNIQLINGDLTPGPQISVPGCNPHDIEFLDGARVLLSCYDQTYLAIVDVRAQTVETATVDLSVFADADGKTELDHMVRIGDVIYVSLQRLNNYAPAGNGLVAAVDAKTLALIDTDPNTDGVQAYELTCEQPMTDLLINGKRLVVGCAGNFGPHDATAGVASLDVTNGTSEMLLNGVELAGTPLTAALDADGTPYVFVTRYSHPAPNTSVVLDTRLLRPGQSGPEVVYQIDGYNLSGLAFDKTGKVHFGNRSAGALAGVYVFDPSQQSVQGPFTANQPPLELRTF